MANTAVINVFREHGWKNTLLSILATVPLVPRCLSHKVHVAMDDYDDNTRTATFSNNEFLQAVGIYIILECKLQLQVERDNAICYQRPPKKTTETTIYSNTPGV
jgi:hypothetical protein